MAVGRPFNKFSAVGKHVELFKNLSTLCYDQVLYPKRQPKNW